MGDAFCKAEAVDCIVASLRVCQPRRGEQDGWCAVFQLEDHANFQGKW
jgi:hypothetical protein